MTRTLFILSLIINLTIALPAVIMLTASWRLRLEVYENLAAKFGKLKIAFIGDSLTARGGIWAFRLGRYNLDTRNFGHGGFMIRQLTFVAHDVVAKRAAYAFIMAGANDMQINQELGNSSASIAHYRDVLDILRAGGIEPIIQLTLYREHEQCETLIDELNAFLVQYASENQLSIIDLNPILCPQKRLLPEYSLDGAHLTKAAYRIWTDEIIKVLRGKQVL